MAAPAAIIVHPMTVQLQAEDRLAADQAAATEKDKLLLQEHQVKVFQAVQLLNLLITVEVAVVLADLDLLRI